MNIERIKRNITINENGCWIWNGSTTSAGYGQLTEEGKYWTTHRYSYTCVHGTIEENLIIRHMCHNTKCCNPEHLLSGTLTDNYADSKDKYLEASKRNRKEWVIDGVKYNTLREASSKTGIHQQTIIKYTENGIFNMEKYKDGCNKARFKIKV